MWSGHETNLNPVHLGVGAKPGLWTLDWTVDWTLDCILDWILDWILDLTSYIRMAQKASQSLCLSGCLWSSYIIYPEICWWRLGHGALSYTVGYRIISAGANIGNLVVPGRTEGVLSIVMQFAVRVSYKSDFVSAMTTLCVKSYC